MTPPLPVTIPGGRNCQSFSSASLAFAGSSPVGSSWMFFKAFLETDITGWHLTCCSIALSPHVLKASLCGNIHRSGSL